MWSPHLWKTEISLRGPIMLFNFLNFSQCVCLVSKRSTKLKISKSTPKGDISFFLNSVSRTTTNGSLGLQSWFPVFMTSQIVNPTYWNLNGEWGEHLVEHCTFQNRNPVRVFLYHCISVFLYHCIKPQSLPLHQGLLLADNSFAYICGHK